jgi:hypothetical protein
MKTSLPCLAVVISLISGGCEHSIHFEHSSAQASSAEVRSLVAFAGLEAKEVKSREGSTKVSFEKAPDPAQIERLRGIVARLAKAKPRQGELAFSLAVKPGEGAARNYPFKILPGESRSSLLKGDYPIGYTGCVLSLGFEMNLPAEALAAAEAAHNRRTISTGKNRVYQYLTDLLEENSYEITAAAAADAPLAERLKFVQIGSTIESATVDFDMIEAHVASFGGLNLAFDDGFAACRHKIIESATAADLQLMFPDLLGNLKLKE